MSSSNLPQTLGNIQLQLTRYVYSAWLILGVPGCLLDIIIFSRPRLRKTSCCIYFLATCINNLVTLTSGVGPIVYSLNNPNPLTHSLAFCKIRGYIFQINLMLSRWFVSFASIDRYALSSENVRFRQFGSVRNACRVIIVVIIVWSIICSHRLIFYEIKGNVCGILTNTAAAMYHAIYVIVGGFIFPVIIMVASTFLIQRNLARKRRMRNPETNIQVIVERELRRQSFDRQMLRLLYIQIVCYIFLSLPQMINLVFNTIATTYPNPSADLLAIEGFASFMGELMLYVFPVSSFYLYTLTSNTFRIELYKCFQFIPSLWGQYRDNRIAPSMALSTITFRVPNRATRAQPTGSITAQ